MIILIPLAIYWLKLANHLKTRRELFTPREKRFLFTFGLPFLSCLVVVLLFLALLVRTPLAWIVFALALLIAAASLYGSYRKLRR
jgi:hypothetical protein